MADTAAPQKAPSEQELSRALSTIAKIVMGGEIQSLCESLKALETGFNQKLIDMRQDLTRMIDELAKQSEQDRKAHTAALENFSSKMDGTISGLNRRLEQYEKKTGSDLSDIKKGIMQDVDASISALTRRADGVDKVLAKYAQELDVHEKDRVRVSGLLNNFSQVFSGRPFEPSKPAETQPAPESHPAGLREKGPSLMTAEVVGKKNLDPKNVDKEIMTWLSQKGK